MENLPLVNISKKEAFKLLKGTLPKLSKDECYAWKQVYYGNTGCKGTVRDIEAESYGDINESYHLCQVEDNDSMFPEWANVTTVRHFKIVIVKKEIFSGTYNPFGKNTELTMIPSVVEYDSKDYNNGAPMFTLNGENTISLFVDGKVTYNGHVIEHDVSFNIRDFPDDIIKKWRAAII